MPGLLRVLHIVPSLRPDGAERIAAHTVMGLDPRRFAPSVISISRPVGSDLEGKLGEAGVHVCYLGKGRGFDLRTYRSMHEAFRACRPHILHTHLDVVRYTLPAMIHWKPRLTVHTIHNIAKHEMDWHGRLLQRIAYRRGALPIAVSREVAKSAMRLYGLKSCEVIRNGVPIQVYRAPKITRFEWRAAHGFGQQEILFVCVGRLARQKNHMLLLQAFARACPADHRLRLILVGTGPLEARLRVEAGRLGLEDRVHFMGRRTDIPELLGAADVFVLSSDWEGNPVALMEAMCAGLPVIGTAVGGVPELFDDGVEGILVRRGDTCGLSGAMLAFCQSDTRQRMGAAASLRAQSDFDVTEMVRAYEQIYSRACACAAGR
jgi:glycosyltransferase involved in cell wall biosynthesis